MIPTIISVLAAARDLIAAHPAEAQWLLAKVHELLTQHESNDAVDVGVVAQIKRREMQAGIAAAVGSAITTAQERAKKNQQTQEPAHVDTSKVHGPVG